MPWGRDDAEALTADIIALAREYERYGYRKICALLQMIKPTLGFQSVKTAYATIKGSEVMRALKKGQGSLFRFRPSVAGTVDLVNRNFGLC